MSDVTPFAAALDQLISRSGMAQSEIARRANVGESYLSRLRRGARPKPTLRVINALGKALEAGAPGALAQLVEAAGGEPIEAESSGMLCFVISPIGDRLAVAGTPERARYETNIQTWENVIEPACQEIGLSPIRADRLPRSGEITEQVVRMLHDADIVVADITGGNANVMYELGLRHTIDRLTILIGEKSQIPFDISGVRIIEFQRTEGGYIDARNRLVESLTHGLNRGFDRVIATKVWSADQPSASEHPAAKPDGVSEEPGFLEIVIEMEDGLPSLLKSMQDFGPVADEMSAITQEVMEEIERSDGLKARLLIALRFAERLDGPIERLEALAATYFDSAAAVDGGMTMIFDSIEAGEAHDITDDGALDFISSTRAAAASVSEFQEIIRHSQKMVAQLGRLAVPLRVRSGRLARAFARIAEASDYALKWGARAKAVEQVVTSRQTTDDSPVV